MLSSNPFGATVDQIDLAGLFTTAFNDCLSVYALTMSLQDAESQRAREPERERERDLCTEMCIVLQRRIVGRVPWCKDYTGSLRLCLSI